MTSSTSRRRRALAAIFLTTFANYLTITILTIALRPITNAFGASVDDAAWVQLAPALVSGLLTPAFGRLSDSVGRLFLFRAGVVLTSVGTLVCAIAPTLGVLVVGRILTGVGTALAVPSGLALASGLYPPERRDVPVGIWTSITAFAPALGVLVGGVVVQRLSWRYLFVGQLPFSALSLVLSFGSIDEPAGEGRGRFDTLGATLFGLSVFALTLIANRVNQWGLTSPLVIGLAICVAIMIPWFLRVEREAETPVLPLRLLADPVVVWATVTRCIVYGVHMGSFIVLPLYLMDIAHLGPAQVALALLPRPIAMGFAAPAVPWLGRRFGASSVTMLGCLSMFVGVGTMPFLDAMAPGTYSTLLAGLVLMGAGLGLGMTTTASELSARARPEDLGAASALLSISTAVAGALGTAGLLAIATSEGAPSAEAYRRSFVACSVLAGVALVTARRYVTLRSRAA